jgi:two-component system, NtrC family, sensor histidine kinase HydH
LLKRGGISPLSAAAALLVALALLIPIVAWLGYRNNRANLERMLFSKGSALIESVAHGSENALLADREITDVITTGMEQACRMALHLARFPAVSSSTLDSLAVVARAVRIDLYDSAGQFAASSNKQQAPEHLPADLLELELGDGVYSAYVTQQGITPDSGRTGGRYLTVTVAGDARTAVCYLKMSVLVNIRNRLGLGLIFDDLSAVQGVRYAVLQDSAGIIAASFNVTSLTSLQSDPFFAEFGEGISGRFVEFESEPVYELASPFSFEGESYGFLRLAVTTGEILAIARSDRNRFLLGMMVLMVLLGMAGLLYFYGRKQLSMEIEHLKVKGFSRSVLDSMAEAVVVTDSAGRIVLMNGACGKICDCELPETAEGRLFSELRPELAEVISLRQGRKVNVSELELALPGRDAPLPLLATCTPLELAGASYTTMILTDLSDSKRAEQLALRSQRYQTMAEMSAGVAHEIRNPLNAIGMNIQRLKLEFSPERGQQDEYEQFIDTIRGEIGRLNAIVEQFLRFSRFPHPHMQAGRLDLLLNETAGFLSAEFQSARIGLETVIGVVSETSFDPDQIRQVYLNLLRNAFQAAGDGGRVKISGEQSRGRYLVRIEDDGPGIAENERERIFEPFYTTNSSGTGLGLAIVSRIVSEHGGEIGVESEPGRGSVFLVSLPVASALP